MSEDFPTFDVIHEPVKKILEIPGIQDPCVKWMRKRGWWARKLSSPQNRSIMDYGFGKDHWYELVEFKAPGKGLAPGQKEEHNAARACGMRPVVFDNVEKFKAYIMKIEGYIGLDRWGDWVETRNALVKGHEQGLEE